MCSNGAYRWTQAIFSTDGNLYAALAPSAATNFTYELQICNAVTKSINSNCTAGSIVNQIGSDGSCLSFGQASVATFNPNPYADGAYLAAYNGSPVSNVVDYSTHIYLICDSTQQMSAPVYEHTNPTYQAHFSINTKFAC